MQTFKKWQAAAGLLLATGSALAGGKSTINIMTYNQYLGADLTPVLAAQSAETFNTALVGVLRHAAQSNFPARARAQAKIVNQRAPDVLALQESWRLSCQDFDQNPATGCEDPQIANAFHDYLDLTLAALNKKKQKYKKAALVKNLDLGAVTVPGAPAPGLPFVINGVNAFLTAIDRDVILVRTEVNAVPAYFSDEACPTRSEDGCTYQVTATADTPIGPLSIPRGFVGIFAIVSGNEYRIINTHLEIKGEDVLQPQFTYYQAMQASELIDAIAAYHPPFGYSILVGDINSSPAQANPTGEMGEIITPYRQFTESAGYLDVWNARSGHASGFSCCQPEDLANRASRLYERIDMIFSIDAPNKAYNIQVLGNKAANKTKPKRPRLWPSDHASVAAKLRYWTLSTAD